MLAILEFVLGLWASVISLFQPNSQGPVVGITTKTPLFVSNTLTQSKEEFTTLKPGVVKMYNCGPTVYAKQHIGNLSMFVFADLLRRTLQYNGFTVKQVINFTDVGHLVSDGDEGEDKMTKGLKAEKKELTIENMLALGEKYAQIFLEDVRKLNVTTEGVEFPRASAFIPMQIAMVRTLEEKGYAYKGEHGVYFDTSRFDRYGKLGNINLETLREGARVAVTSDKRSPTDFLLWKFDPKIGWDSQWGKGFPGWHIECSAMARAILGEQIDIHTGGIEHIPVHHNNEIAQTESVTGKQFARYWLHRAHIQIEGAKIAKSQGNTVYLDDIIKEGYHPLALRYLYLTAHYRTPSNFTWESLKAAQTSLFRLYRIAGEATEVVPAPESFLKTFRDRINDDLDTAGALAAIWEMTKDKSLTPAQIRAALLEADTVLALGITSPDSLAEDLMKKEEGVVVDVTAAPKRIQQYLEKREAARKEKDWKKADEYRDKITKAGYVIQDTPEGPRVVKKS